MTPLAKRRQRAALKYPCRLPEETKLPRFYEWALGNRMSVGLTLDSGYA